MQEKGKLKWILNSPISYLEDRRPAANLDAYLVTAALASVCCLGGKHLGKLREALLKSAQPLVHAHWLL